MPDICVSRSDDNQFIWLSRNGVTSTFLMKDWIEFCQMIVDFNTLGVKQMQNYPDLPTRTPLHANTPSTPRNPKASIDDLV